MRVLEEAERMARESVEGQAIELGWRRDNAIDLDDDDYLDDGPQEDVLVHDDLSVPRRSADRRRAASVDLDRFIRFGFFLGAAFQIQDDLLNLVGDQRVRQGDRRRHLGRQAHAHADSPAARASPAGADARSSRSLARPRTRTAEDVAWSGAAWKRTAASSTRARSRTGSPALPSTKPRSPSRASELARPTVPRGAAALGAGESLSEAPGQFPRTTKLW